MPTTLGSKIAINQNPTNSVMHICFVFRTFLYQSQRSTSDQISRLWCHRMKHVLTEGWNFRRTCIRKFKRAKLKGLGFSLKNRCQISNLKITCFLVQEQVFDQFQQGRIFTRMYKINWIDFDLQSNFDWMNKQWMLKTNIELTTCFHEFSEYESTNFFTNVSQLKSNLFVTSKKRNLEITNSRI